jgi:hypothetical protein
VYELCYPILRVGVFFDKLPVPLGLFDRVEILTLNILDQRNLSRGRIVDFAHERWNGVKAGTLRRAPAPLACDNLEPVSMRPQQDRLQDSPLANRVCKLIDSLFAKLCARLLGIGPDTADLDLTDASARSWRLAGLRARHCRLAEERLEPAA